ncbi:hypothetical protein [Methanonatronarchaeum sp. AMET-Sl]|uniref:hypothetical protein n=1 Tax=Methanonatronarchaeum sp. AMET-Sl TaxID=3037654 RepID=UPI00244DE592|nr:hypothetical protein [Methanonatronarchaeum sp. AMET-Sl]WGI18094.1 hypothetical protein QEN48_03580 [Methanonatronarchaeum sp. AMET-Sl]
MKKILVVLLILALGLGVATTGCLNGYDELELEEFKFVEDQEAEDPDEWVERDAEYTTDEIYVYTYFTVAGFEAVDGEVGYEYEASVYNPDGEHVEDLDYEDADTLPADDYDWVEIWFAPYWWDEAGWDTGTWEIEFVVQDTLGDTPPLEFTKTFEVVEA